MPRHKTEARDLAKLLGEIAERDTPSRRKLAEALLERLGGINAFANEIVDLLHAEGLTVSSKMKVMLAIAQLISASFPEEVDDGRGDLRGMSTQQLEHRILSTMKALEQRVDVDAADQHDAAAELS